MLFPPLVLTVVVAWPGGWFGGWAGAALPAYAQAVLTPASPQRYVAIGCISRAPRPPAGSGATAGRYLLTDPRGDRPTVYRLEGGDAPMLELHVGHTVEISGPLTVGAGSAATLSLKVGSLTYVSSNCRNPPAK